MKRLLALFLTLFLVLSAGFAEELTEAPEENPIEIVEQEEEVPSEEVELIEEIPVILKEPEIEEEEVIVEEEVPIKEEVPIEEEVEVEEIPLEEESVEDIIEIEEIVKVDRQVKLHASWETQDFVTEGEEVYLWFEAIGFDDVEYTIQWEESADKEHWAPIKNETSPEYRFIITKENAVLWRRVVLTVKE